jgi:hypothetical protein
MDNNEDSIWNEELETAVKVIGDESKGYKIMHIHMAQKASQIYTSLTVAGIILGPLASVFSSIESLSNPNKSFASVCSILLGFLSGVTVAIIKFGKYDEVSNANKTASARYTSIESNVRRQLSLQRKDRIPAIAYMEWLESKYEELFLSAPLLPRKVYDKYIYTAKKQGITIPERYYNHHDLDIEHTEAKKAEIVDISDITITNHKNDEKPLSIIHTSTFSSFADLNQYSDTMLRYEMKRMNLNIPKSAENDKYPKI